MRQDLDADGAAQMRPKSNLLLSLLDRVFEVVVNALHDRFLDFVDGPLSNHGRHFGVEGPAWNEVLHGHGIIARTQAML